MKRLFHYSLTIILLSLATKVLAQEPIMYWDFERNMSRTSIEVVNEFPDTLEGNFELAEGELQKI